MQQKLINDFYQDYYRVEYLKDSAHNKDVKACLAKLSYILNQTIYFLEGKKNV